MIFTEEEIKHLFNKFSSCRVLVIGDVMIDSYLWGKVERISPEAPVPVVSVEKRENLLGGAANVALNIMSLGAVPVLCSVIGTDVKGNEFVDLLTKDGIISEGIIRSRTRLTTTKFRIIGNKAQMLRVDEEMDTDLEPGEENELLLKVTALFAKFPIGVVILQDYNKGVLTKNVIGKVIEMALGHGIPVVVDPKKKNFDAYSHIDLFKPNLKELSEGLKVDLDINDISSIKSAALAWQTKQSITAMMVTLSEAGVYIRDTSGGQVSEFHIPAHIRTIADVSGAGDTVISVASLCRALGVTPFLTASLSNLAGGLVCENVGVVPVNRLRLLKESIELIVKA